MWGCTAVVGGLMTRTVISAQLSDPLMPVRLRTNFGHKFEEGEVASSVALQQHWLLRRLYMYLWRSGAMRKYNILLEQADFQVGLRCMHTCMTLDAAVILLMGLCSADKAILFLAALGKGGGGGGYTPHLYRSHTSYHKLCWTD